MTTTSLREGNPTLSFGNAPVKCCPEELQRRYEAIVEQQQMSWTEHHRFLRLLGAGRARFGLSESAPRHRWVHVARRDQTLFAERFEDEKAYDQSMAAWRQSPRESRRFSKTMLDVQNFVDRNRIRMMEMEWIDGYDLSHLLSRSVLAGRASELAPTLDVPEQRDRHRWLDAVALQAGRSGSDRPRMSGRARRAASREHRAR